MYSIQSFKNYGFLGELQVVMHVGTQGTCGGITEDDNIKNTEARELASN